MEGSNGDADPLSRIQPETKQMFHDAIKRYVQLVWFLPVIHVLRQSY